jgi:hypothetical protein
MLQRVKFPLVETFKPVTDYVSGAVAFGSISVQGNRVLVTAKFDPSSNDVKFYSTDVYFDCTLCLLSEENVRPVAFDRYWND